MPTSADYDITAEEPSPANASHRAQKVYLQADRATLLCCALLSCFFSLLFLLILGRLQRPAVFVYITGRATGPPHISCPAILYIATVSIAWGNTKK